jgi:AcrR family transcriptional regulator
MNVPERRHPEDTRAQILEAAWDLFRQLGSKTTIADVAERLGMSSANIYRFYASKQALCEAVCANQLGGIVEIVRHISVGPGKASQRIRAILLAMNVAMREQMLHEKRVHEMVETAISERWAPIDAYENDIVEILAGLVAEGQRAGEFGPGNPAALGMFVVCACSGIHHPHLIALYGDEESPTPGDIADFALRALANMNPPHSSSSGA